MGGVTAGGLADGWGLGEGGEYPTRATRSSIYVSACLSFSGNKPTVPSWTPTTRGGKGVSGEGGVEFSRQAMSSARASASRVDP